MSLPSPKTLWNELLIALSLLTRLPVPYADFSDQARPPARAAWAYPLVGLVVALPAVAIGLVGQELLIDPKIVALLMVASQLLITGAMHEDGLADCADGFWGGFNRERRLEIMKDSAIGTYGVLALLTAIGLKWAAFSVLISFLVNPAILILFAMLSRASMSIVMQWLPPARAGGLSQQTGHPGWPSVLAGLVLATMPLVFLFDPIGLFLMPLVAISSALLVGWLAVRKIGGQTGDVLGATQSLSEVALLTFAASFYQGAYFA